MAKADYVDISFTGDKDLQRKLNRLVIQTQRKIVRGALRQAMKPVKERAQALVPVKTGLLRASIKQKSRTRRGITRAMVATGTRQDLGISSGAKGFYPAVIEYGAKNQPERSYLRRALAELKPGILANVARTIGQGIENEAKK